MCFLCGWTGGDMQEKGGKSQNTPSILPFSLLRIFRFFTCTENNVPSVINIGNNATDLLTSLLYLSHITWDSRLIDLNIYLKCSNFQPSPWIILISELNTNKPAQMLSYHFWKFWVIWAGMWTIRQYFFEILPDGSNVQTSESS